MQYDMPMSQGRVLPEIRFREIDLPEIQHMEVGSSLFVVMKVEMIEKHSGKYMGMEGKVDGNSVEGTFKVSSVKAVGDKPVNAKMLEKKQFDDVYVKVMSGEMV